MKTKQINAEIAEYASKFQYDPVKWVKFAFPWGKGELKNYAGLKEWQQNVLSGWGDHLKNKSTRYQPYLISVASGHGIGKSALISQILHFGMSVCADCRAVVTANTETQLRTKTWPEVQKWFRLAINSHWFNPTATAITVKDGDHEKSWRADAVTWSENNTEAFAGLHNEGKMIIVIFDEASAIVDKIWEVTEGALTDSNTIILWVAFGNPTKNTGRFRECFRKFRHRWANSQIDSRTVEGINLEQINKWVDDYGVDSDFVKVRVRGIFPSMSVAQFISTDLVDAARGKHLRPDQYNFAPVIIGVDPAWQGDDEFVIGMKQGLMHKILGVYPKNDNDIHMANIVANFEDQYKADAVFIDLGFGTGIYSAGQALGRDWRLVSFAEASPDPGCLNMRMYMWYNMMLALQQGAAIPDDDVLYTDLISPELVARVDGKKQLESKKDMKARGVPSPNRADALALCYAFPVHKKIRGESGGGNHKNSNDYDPTD